jgi:hypothetical protein
MLCEMTLMRLAYFAWSFASEALGWQGVPIPRSMDDLTGSLGNLGWEDS